MACMHKGKRRNTGNPVGLAGGVPGEPSFREEQGGPDGVADRAVVVNETG